ncbi:MAG: TlpA disulfide reductase family protein [Bacteroidota bacterium]
MKLRFWLFSMAMIGAIFALAAKGDATVSGNILNASGGEISLSYNANLVGYNLAELKAELSEDGQFTFEMSLDRGRQLLLVYNGKRQAIYVYPETDLQLSFDLENFGKEGEVSGTGDGVIATQALMSYEQQFGRAIIGAEQREYLQSPSAEKMIQYAQGLKERQLAWLEEWQANEAVPASFLAQMEDHINYGYANFLFTYPRYYAYYQKLEENEEVPLPEDYYDFLNDLKTQDDQALYSGDYRSFTTSYLNYRHQQEQAEDAEHSLFALLETAKNLFEGSTLGYVQGTLIVEEMKYSKVEDGLKAYPEYIKQDYAEMFLAEVRPTYEITLALSAGNPAPSFTLMSKDGDEVSLADFEGKVVYLDFWASWCGPCIAEMPYGKKLKEKLKGEDVVFVYISIDDTKEAWVQGLEDNEMEGVQLWTPGWQTEVVTSYGVEGIPNYFLINRDGTINMPNPDRPSGEGVEAQIRAALELDLDADKSRK